MDCITPMLSEALNSIDDWGDLREKVENILPPDD